MKIPQKLEIEIHSLKKFYHIKNSFIYIRNKLCMTIAIIQQYVRISIGFIILSFFLSIIQETETSVSFPRLFTNSP